MNHPAYFDHKVLAYYCVELIKLQQEVEVCHTKKNNEQRGDESTRACPETTPPEVSPRLQRKLVPSICSQGPDANLFNKRTFNRYIQPYSYSRPYLG